MRRDYVTLHVDPAEDREVPTVAIEYDGPEEPLEERLRDADGELRTAEGIDVAYRLQTPADADRPAGVFSLADRLTGEYILEVNTPLDPIRELIAAARDDEPGGDADGPYRIELRQDGETRTFEKDILLVYDDDGSLLRQYSLIPSGVEL